MKTLDLDEPTLLGTSVYGKWIYGEWMNLGYTRIDIYQLHHYLL